MAPDDYESVLGIPPGPRPPTHYELLGLEQFEADPARIEAAYQRRVAQAERCSALPDHRLRPLIQEIYLAKACLLGEKSKADYDRHLTHRVAGSSDILLLESPAEAPAKASDNAATAEGHSQDEGEIEVDRGNEHLVTESDDDGGQFEQHDFGDVSIAGIAAEKKGRSKKPKSRRLFWLFTAFECLVVAGLFYYLRSRNAEPAPPKFVVRQPSQPPGATGTQSDKPTQRQRQQPERDPFFPADSQEPPGSSSDDPLNQPAGTPPATSTPGQPQASLPAGPAPTPMPEPAPSITPSPETPTGATPPLATLPSGLPPAAPPPTAAPPGTTPATAPAPSPAGDWMLRFPASGDWSLDGEMLVLGADDKQAIAALAGQNVFTLRDTSTNKPMAVMQYDAKGHPTGIVPGRFPEGDYHAALKFNERGLSRAWVFNEAGQCILFEYRGKGRAKMFCLVEAGVPLAVQIRKGKDADAYWIDRQKAKPVAIRQSDLPAQQAEQLSAAVTRLEALEDLIDSSEQKWKSALTKWWMKHDQAVRQKPAGRDEYIRKLMDEQHAGLDKLLGQF